MIPNIFHFIFGLSKDFGGKPFNLSHYLAIKSAIEINNPNKVYFYYQHLPETEWFKKIQDKLELVKVDPPTEIFGNPAYSYSYRSAVLYGYLVDHLPPIKIITDRSKHGIHWNKGDKAQQVNRRTGETKFDYIPDKLDFEVL